MSLINRWRVGGALAVTLVVMAGCTPIAPPPPAASASTPVASTVVKPAAPPSTPTLLPLPKGGSSTKRSVILGCQKKTDEVIISFDDGISSQKKLNKMLRTLDKNNVRAYFFMLGEFAKAHPSMMKQIKDAGHVVGNHSYDHPNFNTLTKKQIKSQIRKGVQGNTQTKLLRPPYGNGAFDKNTKAIAKSLGYGMCYWTVDTRDWSSTATKSAKDILKRVRKGDKWTPSVVAGGVILLHGTTKYGAASLQGIIDTVRAKGLKLLPLRG